MINSLFREGNIDIGTVVTAGSCRIEVNRWWQDCKSYEQYYLYSQTCWKVSYRTLLLPKAKLTKSWERPTPQWSARKITQWCDQSSESSWRVHSNGAVCVITGESSFSSNEYILIVLFTLLLKREFILYFLGQNLFGRWKGSQYS